MYPHQIPAILAGIIVKPMAYIQVGDPYDKEGLDVLLDFYKALSHQSVFPRGDQTTMRVIIIIVG